MLIVTSAASQFCFHRKRSGNINGAHLSKRNKKPITRKYERQLNRILGETATPRGSRVGRRPQGVLFCSCTATSTGASVDLLVR